MKNATSVIWVMMMLFCQTCSSGLNSWETNDVLNASVQGGEDLNVSTGLTKYISISDSGIDKAFDSQLMANDVKNIYMNSSAFLILKDERNHVYTNNLVIKNNLMLSNESNVVINHDGEINANKTDLSSPDVNWWTTLEFPESLDLKKLELNSSMDLTPDQELNYISIYMGQNDIAYTTGSKTQFSDSKDGVTVKWGEGQDIIMGGS